MSSLSLSLNTSASSIINKFEEIQELALKFVSTKDNLDHSMECDGYAVFRTSAARYQFEQIEDLAEVRTIEDLNDLYIWQLNLSIYKPGKHGAYPFGRSRLIRVDFEQDNNLDAVAVRVTDLDYTTARRLIDSLSKFLNCSVARVNSEDRRRAQRLAAQAKCVERCVNIFERLPELQARITKSPQSEKDVQEFVYPILKSHFPDMQEEDYLPKVAGASSKPDFGVIRLGVAIEIKYLGKNKAFKKLAEELHDDSRKYFGKNSPYETMVVLIYNGASSPTPANFIVDLEQIDVFARVIISPNIIPKS